MANFDLSFTGSQIDSALGKVVNAETSVNADPASTNMIESAAVYNALNGLTPDNFADAALIESGDTFPNNNDTIPTCGAVKGFLEDPDLLASETYTVSREPPSAGYTLAGANFNYVTLHDTPNSIASRTAITVPATGVYDMAWRFYVKQRNDISSNLGMVDYTPSSNNVYIYVIINKNGQTFVDSRTNPSGSSYTTNGSPNGINRFNYTRKLVELNQGDEFQSYVRLNGGSNSYAYSVDTPVLTLTKTTPFLANLKQALGL